MSITDETVARALAATDIGIYASDRARMRAALEAVAPSIRAQALDSLDDAALLAIHDHIHTIMDERAKRAISPARRKTAAALRAAAR